MPSSGKRDTASCSRRTWTGNRHELTTEAQCSHGTWGLIIALVKQGKSTRAPPFWNRTWSTPQVSIGPERGIHVMSDLLGKVRPSRNGDSPTSEPASESDADSSHIAVDAERSDGEVARGELPLDPVFDALSKARRRWALRYLRERDERVSLSDLAEHVAAIENGTTTRDLGSQERKRVYVSLYQCHLPKLDDLDVVEYDGNRGHVELGPAAPQVMKYLEVDDDGPETPSSYHYIGFALVSAIASTMAALVGVVGSLAAAGLFVATCVGLAGMAAADAVVGRR